MLTANCVDLSTRLPQVPAAGGGGSGGEEAGGAAAGGVPSEEFLKVQESLKQEKVKESSDPIESCCVPTVLWSY